MKTWSYFLNPFLNAVRTSNKRAVKISTYTDAALFERQADLFFGPIYLFYHPIHLALVAAYNNWKTQGGTQKGATLNVDQLLHLLSPARINTWDLQISVVFAPGTPQYVAILPNGHAPFQAGTIDERVNAVQQLGNALTGIVPLAATKLAVDGFYTLLNNARTAQEGEISDTKSDSDVVFDAVRAAMVALYQVLARCMDHFALEPTDAEPIFDLQTIRDHSQVVFTGTLDGNEIELIVEHTFAPTDEILLENDGDSEESFYLAANDTDGPAGQTLITLAAHTSQTITADQFVNLGNHFLKVVNNEAVEGHFRVDIG